MKTEAKHTPGPDCGDAEKKPVEVLADVLAGFYEGKHSAADLMMMGSYIDKMMEAMGEGGKSPDIPIKTLEWPRVCFGSSGKFAQIGTRSWWERMAIAMDVVCNDAGTPATKLHGLRMLNPEVFVHFPFASADSTNIARNIGIDSAWRGTYTPANKEARAQVMRERIEAHQSAPVWIQKPRAVQEDLLEAI